MTPRGTRIACSLRSEDGCTGLFDVYPGEAEKTISKIEPVKWDKEPAKDVVQGAFSIIGEMGMTGRILLLNQQQWRTLNVAKLQEPFYSAILWGGNPMKVVEDAALLAKRTT